MNPESTLFIIKPDAQPAREEILVDLLDDGFSFCHLTQAPALQPAVWAAHYREHQGRSFFDELIYFMSSGPVTICKLQRLDAIQRLRVLVGATKIDEAAPGTLRHSYRQYSTGRGPSTLVHASDSPKSARHELEQWARICGWVF